MRNITRMECLWNLDECVKCQYQSMDWNFTLYIYSIYIYYFVLFRTGFIYGICILYYFKLILFNLCICILEVFQTDFTYSYFCIISNLLLSN